MQGTAVWGVLGTGVCAPSFHWQSPLGRRKGIASSLVPRRCPLVVLPSPAARGWWEPWPARVLGDKGPLVPGDSIQRHVSEGYCCPGEEA